MRRVDSKPIFSRLTSRWVTALAAAALFAGVLLAGTSPASAESAGPIGVSSDGSTINLDDIAPKDVASVPATVGSGDTDADDGSRQGPINPGPSQPVGTSSIIEPDERVQETNTQWHPASAAVQLTTTEGDQDSHYCSGWMASADTVITAGHCVYDPEDEEWISGVKAFPGRAEIDDNPYGFCEAVSYHTVDKWTEDGDREYDYGAVKLDCTVGEATGTFGYRWQSDDLDDTGVATRGYPGDKEDGNQQWVSYGQIQESDDRQLFYDNDTVGGQSGSSIYAYRDDCNGPCSLAIHAYGTGSGPFNSGTRINEEVFNFLNEWSGN